MNTFLTEPGHTVYAIILGIRVVTYRMSVSTRGTVTTVGPQDRHFDSRPTINVI
jgi:hypothetical protein